MGKVKFREHRGALKDSMKTLVELNGRRALISHIADLLRPWGIAVEDRNVELSWYHAAEPRIGWKETWIVTVSGYGVIGFADSNPEREVADAV